MRDIVAKAEVTDWPSPPSEDPMYMGQNGHQSTPTTVSFAQTSPTLQCVAQPRCVPDLDSGLVAFCAALPEVGRLLLACAWTDAGEYPW